MTSMEDAALTAMRRTCLAVRRDIVEMMHRAGTGHPGGSLSAVEILVALYFQAMRIRPNEPNWPDRDRLILSKGHAGPALYAVLAERGFLPVEELKTFNANGTRLQKHVDMHRVPGAEVSSGSLGQGLSVGVGMALADRMDGKERYVYVLLGDGETQEGQVWEAAMAASQFGLQRLIAILDFNRLQLDGPVCDIIGLEPAQARWQSFGWHVQCVDGHDLAEIVDAIAAAKAGPGQPHLVIANTVKGKGVSFMENRVEWHAKVIEDSHYGIAMSELAAAEAGLAAAGGL